MAGWSAPQHELRAAGVPPLCRKNGGHIPFYLRVSTKKAFIASHDRRSARSL